jgi:hypothetical protein
MSREPVVLNSGLEVHFIQELYGNDDAILDVYDLRKNFGKRSKTLWRFEVPQGLGFEVIKSRLKECCPP